MQYRSSAAPAGRSARSLSAVGSSAGDWGTVDDEASIQTLLHAYERGINFVDTAELYGTGTAKR